MARRRPTSGWRSRAVRRRGHRADDRRDRAWRRRPSDKLRIARRLHDFACDRHGLPPSDLLFDPLTFTICTGNEDDRKLGLETLEASSAIAQAMPECQIILGLSNISFGLNPPARHVLNSVFLDHALRRGLTGAIVHVSKIMPLHQIPAEELRVAEDLIFDRRHEGYDPLHAFIALFEDRAAETGREKGPPGTARGAARSSASSTATGRASTPISTAMASYKPLDIINNILLDGMKMVGELFGAGKMQLPFVLQSAETMKAAVGYLEPLMEKVEGQEKGTIVLATVRGDVHDIGKNLVDIILTNNGYRVVNLGIKQPIDAILEAAGEHKADADRHVRAAGQIDRGHAREPRGDEPAGARRAGHARRRGADPRAMSRRIASRPMAAGRVAYARDAFDGLGADGQDRQRQISTRIWARSGRKSEGGRSSRRASSAAPPTRGRCGRSMSRKSACAGPS